VWSYSRWAEEVSWLFGNGPLPRDVGPDDHGLVARAWKEQRWLLPLATAHVTRRSGRGIPNSVAKWTAGSPGDKSATPRGVPDVRTSPSQSCPGLQGERSLGRGPLDHPGRSLKDEEVYPHGYESVAAATAGIARSLTLYKSRRPHSSLTDRTPDDAYLFPRPLPAAA